MTRGYDSWKAREPDLSQCFEAGEFATREEAECVADSNYADKHVEFERIGSRWVLWVWE